MLLLALCLFLAARTAAVCPDGMTYEPSQDSCYKYVSDPLGWLAAEQYCNLLSGNLVFIQNSFENTYVGTLTQGNSTWIGLNYLMANSWQWSANSISSFTKWAPGSPSQPTSNPCVFMQSYSVWANTICSQSRPFICEASNSSSTAPSVVTCGPGCSGCTCGAGYEMYPGTCRCYKYNPAWQKYDDAKLSCASEGSTIVKIGTGDVNSYLLTIWLYTNDDVWIGLYCPTSNKNDCYWPDGSPLNGFDKFVSGHPLANTGTYMTNHDQGNWVSLNTTYGYEVSYFCERGPTTI